MSIKRMLANVGTGYLSLWLLWTSAQALLSPIFAQGLLLIFALVVGAMVLNVIGGRIIDFVRGVLFIIQQSFRKPSQRHRRKPR
ncbi:hypothetical protein RKD55_004582 [Rossellomorea marisflavi]